MRNSESARRKNSEANRLRRAQVKIVVDWQCTFCKKKEKRVPCHTKSKFCRQECYAKSIKGKKHNEEWKKNQGQSQKGHLHHSWKEDRELLERRTKFASICRGLVRRAVKQVKSQKRNSSFKELGYSFEEFMRCIESKFLPGMSWNNHGFGSGKWHIDHIKPVSSFDEGTLVSTVNSLSNIQPLWHEENLKKGKKNVI